VPLQAPMRPARDRPNPFLAEDPARDAGTGRSRTRSRHHDRGPVRRSTESVPRDIRYRARGTLPLARAQPDEWSAALAGVRIVKSGRLPARLLSLHEGGYFGAERFLRAQPYLDLSRPGPHVKVQRILAFQRAHGGRFAPLPLKGPLDQNSDGREPPSMGTRGIHCSSRASGEPSPRPNPRREVHRREATALRTGERVPFVLMIVPSLVTSPPDRSTLRER
jgi:hypothetical protein